MTDRHKHPPIGLRLPEADRLWLLNHARDTETPVNAILARALRIYRERVDDATGEGPAVGRV